MKPTLLYLKIYKNRIVVKNLNTNSEIIVNSVFSNDNYLLAEISVAAKALKEKKRKC